jgi:hypothetical protein
MTKLSDTQHEILNAASQHRHLLARPPARLPAGARTKVADALLRLNLLIAFRGKDEQRTPDALWKVDGETYLLRLTDEGLRAIGLDPNDAGDPEPDTAPQGAEDAAPQGEDALAEESAQGAPTAAEEDEMDDDRPRHERLGIPDSTIYGPEDETNGREADIALLDQALASPAPRGLRAAAQQLLAAWDASPAQDASDNPISRAIEALRATLAGKPPRTPRQPGSPRQGTKQETVLTMLRRPEGATVAQIAEATGWAAHTVRGFFAGLKKKGHAVEVLERVRQVGPNKEGAKGSYSVYHLPG